MNKKQTYYSSLSYKIDTRFDGNQYMDNQEVEIYQKMEYCDRIKDFKCVDSITLIDNDINNKITIDEVERIGIQAIRFFYNIKPNYKIEIYYLRQAIINDMLYKYKHLLGI